MEKMITVKNTGTQVVDALAKQSKGKKGGKVQKGKDLRTKG